MLDPKEMEVLSNLHKEVQLLRNAYEKSFVEAQSLLMKLTWVLNEQYIKQVQENLATPAVNLSVESAERLDF